MRRFIIAASIALSASACAAPDCSGAISTAEMRECARSTLLETERRMNGVVSRIAHDLVEFTGKPHADEFIELQKQWAALTESQCLHQRGLYGRGTMGGVSQANCLQRLFERRTEDLEALYRDVLSLLSLPE